MMEKVLAVVAGVAHLAKHRHIICLILPPSHPSGLKSINLFFRIKDISTSQKSGLMGNLGNQMKIQEFRSH